MKAYNYKTVCHVQTPDDKEAVNLKSDLRRIARENGCSVSSLVLVILRKIIKESNGSFSIGDIKVAKG